MITQEFLAHALKEAFDAFEERLSVRFEGIDERFESIEARLAGVEDRLGSLETRVELGFADLVERLDAEQVFTSDMWDEFSTRLAVLEAK